MHRGAKVLRHCCDVVAFGTQPRYLLAEHVTLVAELVSFRPVAPRVLALLPRLLQSFRVRLLVFVELALHPPSRLRFVVEEALRVGRSLLGVLGALPQRLKLRTQLLVRVRCRRCSVLGERFDEPALAAFLRDFRSVRGLRVVEIRAKFSDRLAQRCFRGRSRHGGLSPGFRHE